MENTKQTRNSTQIIKDCISNLKTARFVDQAIAAIGPLPGALPFFRRGSTAERMKALIHAGYVDKAIGVLQREAERKEIRSIRKTAADLGELLLEHLGLVMILAVGIVWLIIGTHYLERARDTETWDEIEGTITVSEVRKKRRKSGDRGTRTIRYAYIEYAYWIDGAEYRSNRVTFSIDENDPDLVRKYPVGKMVTVYFDPRNRRESVLVRGVTEANYTVFYLSAFILCLIPILYFLFHRKKTEKMPMSRCPACGFLHVRRKEPRNLIRMHCPECNHDFDKK